MPEVHAKLFSASASAKWLHCPAALALEALTGDTNEGTDFSREGTAAHEILEKCMVLGVEPSSFLGQTITLVEKSECTEDKFFVDVTQEMIDAVEVCKEYADRLSARSSFYEQKVDYSHIAPNGFGTADIIKEVYEKTANGARVNKLYVIDFKYGAGVRVAATENSQGMLYGLGALNTLDMLFERAIETVVIVIVQPRMDNVSEFEINVKDLVKWGEEVVKPAALKAGNLYEAVIDGEKENALNPGDFRPDKKTCQWCLGKRLAKCKAYATMGFDAAVEGFSDLTAEEKLDLPGVVVSKETLKSTALIDSNDLAAVFKAMSLFKAFAENVETEIRRRIHSGEVVPGLKLEPTLKAREWFGEEEEIVKALRTSGLQKSDYEVFSIISPTKAEALLKKLKPKDYKKRYEKLESTLIKRAQGKEKITTIKE